MGYFNESTGSWELFGTAPISDAYFKFITPEEEDQMLRDIIISSACEVPKEVPFEEFEGIGIDMSGDEPIFSKGWKKFFG